MDIVNLETLVLIIIASLLIFTLGFLAAKIRTGKQVNRIENTYQNQGLMLEKTESKLNQVTDELTSTLDKLHGLELHNKGLETLHAAQSEQQKATEQSLLDYKDKLAKNTHAMHEAEKSNKSLETELLENRKSQRTLDQQLVSTLNELQEERNAINQKNLHYAALDKKAKTFEIQAQENNNKYIEARKQLTELQTKLEALQSQHTQLSSSYAELKTSLQERDLNHAKQIALFDEQKQALSEQFKVLANDILDSKSKALEESSKMSLSTIMNPFQQAMNNFKKEVHDIHHRETTQQGELKKELASLKELNQKITIEAHELSTALRGQKKLQGNWGELVLENVLDRSGLQLGVDYKREVSFTTENGRQRPDAIVYLPQNKHLIIDAKVSLSAYTRFVNSEQDADRQTALNEHVKAMGDRINELANRDYYKLDAINSPEMVFMFVPIESAFVEALKSDETLFQKAIEKNVLVATPTTLLTSLNIVRQLWRYEDQNKHTAALANKAETVFKKLNAFLGSFEAIKKNLDKANEAYTKAEGQLISGRGNLVKQVGEFKNLAPAIKAELPAYFTDKASLEIDFVTSNSSLENTSTE